MEAGQEFFLLYMLTIIVGRTDNRGWTLNWTGLDWAGSWVRTRLFHFEVLTLFNFLLFMFVFPTTCKLRVSLDGCGREFWDSLGLSVTGEM